MSFVPLVRLWLWISAFASATLKISEGPQPWYVVRFKP
jgi:hypothetical protein